MYRIAIMTLSIGLSFGALAQNDARRPSAEEIIERLNPVKQTPAPVKSRGISIEGAKAVVDTTPPSIDLEVSFEFGATSLTPDARIVLDSLGKALSAPALMTSRFLIAGHTDGAGGDAQNLVIFKRRAQTVAGYLRKQHGIAYR